MNDNIKYLFEWARAREIADTTFIPHYSLTLMKYKYVLVKHVYDTNPSIGTVIVLDSKSDKRSGMPSCINIDTNRETAQDEYYWCELALKDPEVLNG